MAAASARAEDARAHRRVRAFISYSRVDVARADELVAALRQQGLECLMDKGLPGGEKWKAELETLIASADAVVFLVSPDSMQSPWCRWELALVARFSKRLVPVVVDPVPVETLPQEIGEIQLLALDEGPIAEASAATLADAVTRDRAWLLQHTMLAEQAAAWRASSSSSDRLLRGAALREAESWNALRPARAPRPTSEQLDYLLASQLAAEKARARRRLLIGGAAAGLFALANAYLVSLAGPDYWERIPQPSMATAYDDKPFLPVKDVAIDASDPARVLYLAKSSDWDASSFWIGTREAPKDLASRVRERTGAKTGAPAARVARIELRVVRPDGTARCRGVVDIDATTEPDGRVRFFRSLSLGPDRDGRAPSLGRFALPHLVRAGGDPFGLGEYAELLLSQGLLGSDDSVDAVIHDMTTGISRAVRYDVDDRIADGETTARRGSEFAVLASPAARGVQIGGVPVSPRADGATLWKEVERSALWIRHQAPKTAKLGGNSPAALAAAVPEPGNLAGLLRTLEWPGPESRREGVETTMTTTVSPVGRAQLLHLAWWRSPQGSGKPVDDEGHDRLLRLGGQPWRRLDPPAGDIEGVWLLDASGGRALLLSASQGFFETRDGGATWAGANLNETGFADGRKVKPIVVKGSDASFALIDRGAERADGENPLFRLRHRSLAERWRAGLAQWLR